MVLSCPAIKRACWDLLYRMEVQQAPLEAAQPGIAAHASAAAAAAAVAEAHPQSETPAAAAAAPVEVKATQQEAAGRPQEEGPLKRTRRRERHRAEVERKRCWDIRKSLADISADVELLTQEVRSLPLFSAQHLSSKHSVQHTAVHVPHASAGHGSLQGSVDVAPCTHACMHGVSSVDDGASEA